LSEADLMSAKYLESSMRQQPKNTNDLGLATLTTPLTFRLLQTLSAWIGDKKKILTICRDRGIETAQEAT